MIEPIPDALGPDPAFAATLEKSRSARSPMRAVMIGGFYVGVVLSVVMLTALVIANRIPGLETYAFERNAACFALFAILMLVPVIRYLNRPSKMFVSSMTSWVVLVIAYDLAGIYFHNLFDVLQRTPFEVLAEGAIVYGVLAVASWVCGMVLHARRHSIAPSAVRTRPSVFTNDR